MSLAARFAQMAARLRRPFGTSTYEALALPIAGTLSALVVQVPDDESRERLTNPGQPAGAPLLS